ncbi:MAG: hypothetical protein FD143_3037 [Ignavibacteria bacterium]|nr:MAG: hypothetical protein FD143_3037 [Ignavibacteria bacterium]
MTNFICPYCFGIPRDPVFLHCGHLICMKCGRDAIRIQGADNHTRDKGTWVPCPKCRAIYSANALDSRMAWDSWAKNVFNTINIDCSNECGFMGPPSKTDTHEVYHCKKRKLECPHFPCTKVFTAEEMCAHFDECTERQVYCKKCHLPIPFKEADSHDCITRMHKALDGIVLLIILLI